MKYQIILESAANMPDDEFLEAVGSILAGRRPRIGDSFRANDRDRTIFTITEARSLEGIRPEVYKKPDDFSDLL